ncbi:MAG: leucyl aminopeptidase, partial [Chlorobi bacterium CHB2]|nr:leucyl aminopeptidase [Chlorobi bacterium CHB2]
TPADVAQAISEGLALGVYSYDKHISQKPNGGFSAPNKVVLLGLDAAEVKGMKAGMATGKAVSDGVLLARDLANAPSNEIDPQTLAARAKELSSVGVKVTVLTKAQIEKLGMGGLVAVNKGGVIPPSFIIMEWKGGGKDQPLVFVGKGVTFDSGGISIKPGAGMADMKLDMGGAAAVIGAMHTIATLKLKQNVIGLVAATENMPSGTAFKPGDVIKHLNGKTSEIDNTDAEGRLILADALAYADRYKPQAVIDLATLTGACVVALGNVASGLMGNTPELNNRIRQSGDRTYDRVVELPLWEEYEELIKSDVADVKNSGGRGAGTITAGLFLKTFIGNYPWAHIDIAGTGMTSRPSGYINKGGTGAGVRLLVDFVQNWTSL